MSIDKSNRYYPLDILRGLTIFGMILTAITPGGVFPAWMYHIQNPPPTHNLDMNISGLSWVDLVFPIFIFCMGVAIPMAGRRNPDITAKVFMKGVFSRFIMLWAFSYLYVLTLFTDISSIWGQIMTLVGFASLFLIYLKIPKTLKSKALIIRIIGWISVVATILIGHFYLGETIALGRRGIIIFLLAFLYLFGSTIWYFTKDKLSWRLIAIVLVFIFTLITQHFDLPVKSYANPAIRWWFNVEYVYFLLLLLPSTIVGDIIAKQGTFTLEKKKKSAQLTIVQILIPLILIVLPIFLVISFYNREAILPIAAVSIASMLALMITLTKLKLKSELKFVGMITIMLCIGFIMEPLDGGIKKVPCTISYCFITAAISLMLMIAIDFIYQSINWKYRPIKWLLAGAGANPLMSYIAFSNLLFPIMKITGLITLYQACYPIDYPWIGFIRAIVVTTISIAIVASFSSKKIYWKA